MLCLKKIAPTRLVKNDLYDKVAEAEACGASVEELREIIGKAASKRGIFEGNLNEGELEIGQIASAVESVRPAGEIVRQLADDFHNALNGISALGF